MLKRIIDKFKRHQNNSTIVNTLPVGNKHLSRRERRQAWRESWNDMKVR